MLNAGVLRFDAAGRIRCTLSLPTHFNGGTPTNQGLLSGNNGVPNAGSFLGGLGYLAGGDLAMFNAAPAAYIGGLPVTAAGQLCVDATGTLTPNRWVAGIPLSGERVCLAAPEAPVTGTGFDSGFDGGFGA